MALYKTYGSGAAAVTYEWTGANTLNQVSSLVDVPEDIYATALSVYWEGYGASAAGRHALWKVSSPGALVVASGTNTVGSGSASAGGQAWQTMSIAETFIPAGRYFIGFWCDPADRRTWSRWSTGQINDLVYRKTMTAGIGDMGGSSTASGGVLAAYITGDPAGRAWVNDNGTWKKGNVWVNDGGVWKKAKAVWVNDGGTWKQAK